MLRELRDWVEELACRAGFDGLPSGGRAAAWVAAVIAGVTVCALWLPATSSTEAGGVPVLAAAGGSPSGSRAASTTAPALAATVTVHVVGEVMRPGVYALRGGSRAADAIAAAGGLLGAADQAAVNLARVVTDGEQIAVPRQGEGGAMPAASAPGGAAPSGKVDLNTATEAQLDTLPGVGPATATKIVSDRTENGPFSSVNDLLRVPGIGASKLDALRDLVSAK